MQRHRMGRDAFGSNGVQQGRGEMQPRRRRRDRPVMLGEDGLIVRPVAVVLGPFGGDIGRQRHDAHVADRIVQRRSREVKGQGDQPVFPLCRHRRIQTTKVAGGVAGVSKTNPIPRLDPLAGFHEGGPDVGRVAVMQRRLHLDRQGLALGPDPLTHARQTGGNDPRIVEHQGVARLQEVRQIANDPVFQRAAFHHQQPCGIARIGRAQRNTVFGQVEIEIGGLHRALYRGLRRAAPRCGVLPAHRRRAAV